MRHIFNKAIIFFVFDIKYSSDTARRFRERGKGKGERGKGEGGRGKVNVPKASFLQIPFTQSRTPLVQFIYL